MVRNRLTELEKLRKNILQSCEFNTPVSYDFVVAIISYAAFLKLLEKRNKQKIRDLNCPSRDDSVCGETLVRFRYAVICRVLKLTACKSDCFSPLFFTLSRSVHRYYLDGGLLLEKKERCSCYMGKAFASPFHTKVIDYSLSSPLACSVITLNHATVCSSPE